MTVLGLGRKVYRGFGWWVLTQWVIVAGVGLRVLDDAGALTRLVSSVLIISWPLLLLTGVRRFLPRSRFATPAGTDVAVLAVPLTALVLAALGQPDAEGVRVTVLQGGAALSLIYVTVLLWRLPERARSPALQALVLVLALSALPRLARLTQGVVNLDAQGDFALMAGRDWLVLSLLLSAVLVMLLCVALNHERAVQELSDSHDRLRVLADIDMLTAVPNRRHFQELAERLMAQAREPMAVLLFDIDHFKQINDQHGHATGDRALRLVARHARDALRAHDVLGRLGGDEFVAMMPATSVKAAMAGARRIALRVHTASVEDGLPPIGLSLGVVSAQPGETLGQVLLRADAALYEAKRQGRRRAVLAVGESERPVFAASEPLDLDPLPAPVPAPGR
jgi:diguanylate cyclase (GGDEF)-like protein